MTPNVRHLIAGWSLLVVTTIIIAEDRPAAESLTGWQRLFREHAAEYRIQPVGTDSPARLWPDPILKWSQPVRGGGEGAIYLWTLEGRPVTIATLFIWPKGDGRQAVAHELHSLSSQPLDAKWRDRTWTPPKNGITWQRGDNLPAPSTSADQRLRQMRDLARQFQASSRDRQDKTWELRLLTRPIHRYELPTATDSPAVDTVLDGSVFGFVEGTDLEVVLLVQAVQTATGPRWEFAFARMSDYRLTVRRDDRIVWDVDVCGPDTPRAAYHCTTVEYRASPE
jgi:hypothetical protein